MYKLYTLEKSNLTPIYIRRYHKLLHCWFAFSDT